MSTRWNAPATICASTAVALGYGALLDLTGRFVKRRRARRALSAASVPPPADAMSGAPYADFKHRLAGVLERPAEAAKAGTDD